MDGVSGDTLGLDTRGQRFCGYSGSRDSLKNTLGWDTGWARSRAGEEKSLVSNVHRGWGTMLRRVCIYIYI